MKNPAREKFLPMLSPYVDGELTPEERQQVEQHLQNNPESAKQVADLRAGSHMVRHALEMQGDDLDWKKFTDEVMSKVTPERLPFFQRLSISFGEMFQYQRGMMAAGMVGALVAVVIAVPVAMKFSAGTPEGYANSRVEVQTVSIDETSQVRPVVMETEGGDAVIWTIDSAAGAGSAADSADGGKKKKKHGGEEGEEELNLEPPTEPTAPVNPANPANLVKDGEL